MQCWHITGCYTEDDGIVSVNEYVLSPDSWQKGDVWAYHLHRASADAKPHVHELMDNATITPVGFQVRGARLMVSVAKQVTDYVLVQDELFVGVADVREVTVIPATEALP